MSIKAENVCQAQARAAVAVSEKSPMATVIIIRNVQCKGATT